MCFDSSGSAEQQYSIGGGWSEERRPTQRHHALTVFGIAGVRRLDLEPSCNYADMSLQTLAPLQQLRDLTLRCSPLPSA